MTQLTRFKFPADADPDAVRGDAALAIFVAECLYGRPQARLEAAFLVDSHGRSAVMQSRGPAGESATRVFTGLLGQRFGEDGFQVEHIEGGHDDE